MVAEFDHLRIVVDEKGVIAKGGDGTILKIVLEEDSIAIKDAGDNDVWVWRQAQWEEDPDLVIGIVRSVIVTLTDPSRFYGVMMHLLGLDLPSAPD